MIPKRLVLLLALALVGLCLFTHPAAALAGTPEVQIGDVTITGTGAETVVHVDFQYRDAEGDAIVFGLQVSHDDGVTWDQVAGETISGDTDPATSADWQSASLQWAAGEDWPEQISTQTRFRVGAWLQAFARPYLVIDVSGGPEAASYPMTMLDELPEVVPEKYRTTHIVLRRIPAGTFTMGSPAGELGRDDDEVQHEVTLTESYYIGVFELTIQQWLLVMGNWEGITLDEIHELLNEHLLPVSVLGGNWNAVRGGSWPDGNRQPADGTFIATLRAKTGEAFDLPTEAQWEYACRAGTATALNSGEDLSDEDDSPELDKLGYYHYNHDYSNSRPPVGSFLPNGWGLYDMHGGLAEWCLDWYGDYLGDVTDPVGPQAGSKRITRGGAYLDRAKYCRSAFRWNEVPSYDGSDGFYNGIRLCLPGEPVTVAASFSSAATAIASAVAVTPTLTLELTDMTVSSGLETFVVDVAYRYQGAVGIGFNIGLQYSADDGQTWADATPAALTDDRTVIGDATWQSGALRWVPGVDWPGQVSSQMRVRLAATQTDLLIGDYLAIDVSAGPDAPSFPVRQLAFLPHPLTLDYKTTTVVLRRIEAGTFTMGSPLDEAGRSVIIPQHENQHEVTLTQDFYMGVTEVTQMQFERVTGEWGSYFKNEKFRDARPVELLSWVSIRGGSWPGGDRQPAPDTFMAKLRAKTGLAFDLPTEARWEYACRAGTTTALNSGENLSDAQVSPELDALGRYLGDVENPEDVNRAPPADYSDDTVGTANVGSYLPNAWGLYDMHGNAMEWCLDWYEAFNDAAATDPEGPGASEYRVLRGGNFNLSAEFCRSAARWPYNPELNGSYGNQTRGSFGFRLCLPVEQP